MGSDYSYYEFFAGGGMARAGLGAGWRCVFANDFDAMKVATYAANWGPDHLISSDIATLTTRDLPRSVDLAWASFPCQDLSLAGDHRGLGQAAAPVKTRSGTFWPFWELMVGLRAEARAPKIIVLENVHGMLTSRGGQDFAAIGSALAAAGYRFGAVALDAIHFVPQSRPRVFFVAVSEEHPIPSALTSKGPCPAQHPAALVAAHGRSLDQTARARWIWWKLPPPPRRKHDLTDLIDDDPVGVAWHSPAATAKLLDLMSDLNRSKIATARASGRKTVGAVYRRTRPDAAGGRRQRAEVRFDDVAGCLRTPSGGSSRQTIVVVHGDSIRSRLLSPREAARLMGLADDYVLPQRYNDAYHVAGDGICVPVVSHLARSLIEPILQVGDYSPDDRLAA